MKKDVIETLRSKARKLIRELGLLEVDSENSGKTSADWHALVEVDKLPSITISDLGRLLLMSISAVSRLVKSLAKNDFLELREGVDKREKALYLTKKGDAEIKKINAVSDSKIKGAFEFLTEDEITRVIDGIDIYAQALEKSRLFQEDVKIATLSTSRTIRKQIVNMISNIQENEFCIPITEETNACILKAEEQYYYNKSYNFWYAVNEEGEILGSIGLKQVNNTCGQIKKFFVIEKYRGKGVAEKLMQTLLKAASKHEFNVLYLGTIDVLKAAQKFYIKNGFTKINKNELPKEFEANPVDNCFFKKIL